MVYISIESRNCWLYHQVEKNTSRRGDIGKPLVHVKISTSNQLLRETHVWKGEVC